MEDRFGHSNLPRFDRRGLAAGVLPVSAIGGGEPGGKATGLLAARDVLRRVAASDAFPRLLIDVPPMVVLTTSAFERFVDQPFVQEVLRGEPDDIRLRMAFQRASLPEEILGDLLSIVTTWRTPLAVRSSSLLEDALHRPFAGIYDTKMLPNQHTSEAMRFQQLIGAIRFVYASTFARRARSYRRAAGLGPDDDRVRDGATKGPVPAARLEEKMAVIVQTVVGERHGHRFYPDVSIVARSYDFYSAPRGRPEDGVVTLALGLGKWIVDGGVAWSYGPSHPQSPPPFASTEEMLRSTQVRFWAVNLGTGAAYDPTTEVEFLVQPDLAAAEYDGTLESTASTLRVDSGRLSPGTSATGPRVLDFAPLLRLERFPLNAALGALLRAFETEWDAPVEIELAMVLPPRRSSAPARLAVLQVRPIVVGGEDVTIEPADLERDDLLFATTVAMGNGRFRDVHDLVFVDPETFEKRETRAIADEIAALNARLIDEGRPYVLVGFGRWGSSDPWLGIPVSWADVSGARVLVEATRPDLDTEPSQGTHFFHNLTSFQVGYLWVHHGRERGIPWKRLERFPEAGHTRFLRHIRATTPFRVIIDGRSGVGAVFAPATGSDAPVSWWPPREAGADQEGRHE